MNAFLAAYRAGRLEEAEQIARRLVAADGANVRSLHALTTVLVLRRKTREAADMLDAAAKAKPGSAEILNLLAAVLLSDKRPEESADAARKAAEIKPRDPDVLNNLANALQASGRVEEAVEIYRKALAARPDHVDAHYNLGVALQALGRSDAAIDAYRKALALKPKHPAALNNLGLSLHAAERFDEAAQSFEQALALVPRWAQAHHNLGDTQQVRGKFAEAIASYRRALEIAPDVPETLTHLGNSLERQGAPREAEAAYRKAGELKPDNPLILNNIANALEAQDRLDEATSTYRQAIGLDGRNALLFSNLGVALHRDGALDEAVEAYRTALLIDQDEPGARTNLALALLLRGEWDEGWDSFEKRAPAPKTLPSAPTLPRWTGPGTTDGPVLLVPEQGLGDMIQFARFAPLLQRRGIPTILQVWPKLSGLLGGLPNGTRLARTDAPVPEDAASWSPVMSVPAALGLREADLEGGQPYLSADPEQVALWASRLGSDGFRIGIVWQGSTRAARLNRGRSFTLAEFAPLARLPGVRLIALQKGRGIEQVADAPFRVEQPGHGFDEGPDAFRDTAALMMSLDLVVTSDTSVAHLAGALGRPVFIALQKTPDWRWMLEREDTPWYASARLFRQKQRGDWAETFERIAAAVGERMRGGHDARA